LRMVWGQVTVLGYSYHMSVHTRLPEHTMQTKFKSLLMLKHLFPLFDCRKLSSIGQSVLGWVTALWVCVHPISKEQADQLLATGFVSYREKLIQCIALHPHC
jgi:hypothetical protein